VEGEALGDFRCAPAKSGVAGIECPRLDRAGRGVGVEGMPREAMADPVAPGLVARLQMPVGPEVARVLPEGRLHTARALGREKHLAARRCADPEIGDIMRIDERIDRVGEGLHGKSREREEGGGQPVWIGHRKTRGT
jgi:hypothetical protein